MRLVAIAIVAVTGRASTAGTEYTTSQSVQTDFSKVLRKSRTITTLQVVANPILDRTFTAPNGTTFPNPIYKRAWATFAALNADFVRYQPWFPYPQKGVAELDPPVDGKSTSWNFTGIMPMLEDFMNITYANNRTAILNFATQPCWMFGDKDGKVLNCSYPANPDESDWTYGTQGSRSNLLDPSAKVMAAYFARLLAYLVKGEFTDEHGEIHTGGPAYSRFNRENGYVWELFNEVQHEHQYTADQYIHDYDVIVPEMIKAVGGPDHAPAFMGIGGADPPAEYIAPFLNRSRHLSGTVPPIDYISIHHYSRPKKRNHPSEWSQNIFGQAREFMRDVQKRMAERDASSFPEVKFALNELGVILPGDNSHKPFISISGDVPDIYWNAAGAMFAYMFATMAPLGVEVLGQSQLAGSPRIPEWGIPLPQFPGVSMIDWRTGYGNARYWVLKLLIEEFAPGDLLVLTNCGRASVSESVKGAADGDSELELACMAALKPDRSRKLLLVNLLNSVQQVAVTGFSDGGATTLSLKTVDPLAVTHSSPDGIRHESVTSGAVMNLQPYAVSVLSRAASVAADPLVLV